MKILSLVCLLAILCTSEGTKLHCKTSEDAAFWARGYCQSHSGSIHTFHPFHLSLCVAIIQV